jgi:phospholipase C
MRLTRLLLLLGILLLAVPAASGPAVADQDEAAAAHTGTPIKHLVVLFQENVSFDHYFGTYPHALNLPGEPAFKASSSTPTVNGLNEPLQLANPNKGNPHRLSPSQAHTCDMNHGYTDEQKAVDHGAMDLFVEAVSSPAGATLEQCLNQPGGDPNNYAVMDYYDGNTVTALWNYAQRFAMSDNSFSTMYGPSTPGALNLVTGNAFGAICGHSTGGTSASVYRAPECPSTFSTASKPGVVAPQGPGTVYGDPQPFFDSCNSRASAHVGGSNVGDLLNAKQVTWGWFQGGFTNCNQAHTAIGATSSTKDYIPHHEPFQYYQSTANPLHLPPSSAAAIGKQDQANHQYDITDFWKAADSGRLPAVSFLKAPAYQDGHAGYSTPLDEQRFLVESINRLQQLPSWRSTAIVVAYDDSDGWYDHVLGPAVFQSQTTLDALTAPGQCGAKPDKVPSGQQARCGYGPRQPLLMISPFARRNFVDHSTTDQASILRFIEDNWSLGRIGSGSADAVAGSLGGMFDYSRPSPQRLLLDPSTGQPRPGEDTRNGD